MESFPAPVDTGELAAALLQTAVATILVLLAAGLWARYRRPWLGWMTVAWTLYSVRLLIISGFLLSGDRAWLYWHQVTTGWTALALLWAACVFSGSTRWRNVVAGLALFPPLWSWVAIYRLDHFLWAALPAVVFLSAATLWTGRVFLGHWRAVGGSGALVLACSLLLWSLHHLDYPFLRARGAWSPWGYYLDSLFLVTTGLGVVLLLMDELYRGLEARTQELARLSAVMVRQHEEERRRLSRELHDETAQVFSAVKMELAVLRETAPPGEVERLGHVLELVDSGLRGVRRVTANLRPSLLDDLGLLPALRSLAAEFAERSGLAVNLDAPSALPALRPEAELALFRALQEALANVARHSRAERVRVAVDSSDGLVRLAVEDDGQGPAPDPVGGQAEGTGLGLSGMRERIAALGGSVRFSPGAPRGARLEVELPSAWAKS